MEIPEGKQNMTTNPQSEEKTGADLETVPGEETLLKAEGVKKYFQTETGLLERLIGSSDKVKAVDGVDLSIREEETVGLVGESGCGKTTLGRVLARLYEPTDGTIQFQGQDITELTGKDLKQLRKDVQVIFQDPLSSLNPRKTVGEIVGKPMKVHNLASGRERRERVKDLFEEVGLKRSHVDRYPHEFSGGQCQRIGIARALSVEPKLIIADEPVSALDVSVQAQIINLLKRLQNEYNLSYLFIAHDLSVVKHISDRVMVMYLGQIVEKGPTNEIYGNPQHPYTCSLLHSIPSVDADSPDRESLLEGNPPSPINPPDGCPFHPRCPEYIDEECSQKEPELMSVEEASGNIEPTDSSTSPESEEHAMSHRAACHWLQHSAADRREQDPFRENED